MTALGYIYALEDPDEPGHIRYVGFTRNPEARAAIHRRRPPTKTTPEVKAWKKAILRRSRSPRFYVLARGPLALEARWQALAKACGHDILNRPMRTAATAPVQR